ncbi:aminoacyl-tRNA hydrolase [candidate division WWE3 bacterium RIFOXYC1_FULL_39_7]|uniref:Peptidyl-tRNA hydrolase n=2 Tax=Katanobacteria TaxID=422282 RepID=A0A1F4X7H4_UNCKA|nr:MAG: aminoacyl-tRNA hydrolase [candidate division WWE3 bacterium RIFOXYC1_FULL_39_7]OGC77598.1 MAG: aminoacyl-tRNA hydrolase [candidate division WWE3 bacterium RIFOXYD1_FULL_39_9]
MKLIVGLGNPGDKYIKTRHNVGFILLENIVRERGLEFTTEKKFDAEIALEPEYIFLKPHTFMNNSGRAVSKALNFYKIDPENLIVIHDDVDLLIGKLKNQTGANSAGHRGVESVITELGTKEFRRIRIGVGRPVDTSKYNVEDWVLSDMDSDDLTAITHLTEAVKSLI